MSVHISKGNSKLGMHIPIISLPPVATCPRDAPCAGSSCYAHKAWRQYPAVRRAWGENLAEYVMNPKGYMTAILEYVWKHKPPRFRWHVAGDIPNQEYLDYMKMIALLEKDTRFLCFTKRYNYSFRDLPANLSIVLSAWPGYGIIHAPYTARPSIRASPRRGFLPIACCQDGSETRIPANVYECPGGCEACGMCWELRDVGRDVWFHKH